MTASAQLLQNPTQDASDSFKREWVHKRPRLKPEHWRRMNRYLICDPASEKKKTSDYTAMALVGLAADRNYYLIDGIRDRMNLKERTEALIHLHRKYEQPKVGYEKYGMQADIEHIKYVQNQENYRFGIEELGGQVAKLDRIKRLIPVFAEGRWYFPDDLWYTPYDGKPVDLVQQIIEEELLPFPVPVHEDFIDAMSRIFDMPTIWPKALPEPARRDRYTDRRRRSFMGA